jgi:hypothetical protein
MRSQYFLRTRIAVAAILAGSLDIAYAFALNFLVSGLGPVTVLQFVGSGLLGPQAFSGGLAAAMVGMAAHYLIILAFAAAVALAARSIPAGAARPWLLGLASGAALYVLMTFIVVPLSLTPATPPSPGWRTALELSAHILLVGLPAAWLLTPALPRD